MITWHLGLTNQSGRIENTMYMVAWNLGLTNWGGRTENIWSRDVSSNPMKMIELRMNWFFQVFLVEHMNICSWHFSTITIFIISVRQIAFPAVCYPYQLSRLHGLFRKPSVPLDGLVPSDEIGGFLGQHYSCGQHVPGNGVREDAGVSYTQVSYVYDSVKRWTKWQTHSYTSLWK